MVRKVFLQNPSADPDELKEQVKVVLKEMKEIKTERLRNIKILSFLYWVVCACTLLSTTLLILYSLDILSTIPIVSESVLLLTCLVSSLTQFAMSAYKKKYISDTFN